MKLDFKIDVDKLKENKAVGVNLMLGDGRISMLSGEENSIFNSFLMDFNMFHDIETYIISEKKAKSLGKFIEQNYSIIKSTLESIIVDRGYNIDAELVLKNTLENIRVGKKRYGLYLTFETVIV